MGSSGRVFCETHNVSIHRTPHNTYNQSRPQKPSQLKISHPRWLGPTLSLCLTTIQTYKSQFVIATYKTRTQTPQMLSLMTRTIGPPTHTNSQNATPSLTIIPNPFSTNTGHPNKLDYAHATQTRSRATLNFRTATATAIFNLDDPTSFGRKRIPLTKRLFRHNHRQTEAPAPTPDPTPELR